MIDLDSIVAAYEDITGDNANFDIEDVQLRFEMMGIDFDDFRSFLFGRLQALDEKYDFHPEWGRGYVHAALEFFLYGDLCGIEATRDDEIDADSA